MKGRPRPTVFDAARYYDLDVEYTADLPESVCGCLGLGDEPRFILINASHPVAEQRFTIAHEIAHYLFHDHWPRRHYRHWFLSREWQSPRLAELSRRTRRALPIILTKENEADLWAMGLLVQLEDIDALRAYLSRNPKRTAWLIILVLFSLWISMRTIFSNRFEKISGLDPTS